MSHRPPEPRDLEFHKLPALRDLEFQKLSEARDCEEPRQNDPNLWSPLMSRYLPTWSDSAPAHKSPSLDTLVPGFSPPHLSATQRCNNETHVFPKQRNHPHETATRQIHPAGQSRATDSSSCSPPWYCQGSPTGHALPGSAPAKNATTLRIPASCRLTSRHRLPQAGDASPFSASQRSLSARPES